MIDRCVKFMEKTKDGRIGTVINLASLVSRLLLAGIFFFSAIPKIRDPYEFMDKVHEYEVLPDALVEPFSMAMPWAMIACSALLVLGLLTRLGALGLAGMLVSFIVAIGINIYREVEMDCGCFADSGSQVGWKLVAFDSALLAVAGFIIFFGGRRFSIDGLIPWPWVKGKNNTETQRHGDTEEKED